MSLPRALVIAGRADEGEQLYNELCASTPQSFWLHIVAGDAYIDLHTQRRNARWLLRAVHHLARAVRAESRHDEDPDDLIRDVDRQLVRTRLTEIQAKLADHQHAEQYRTEVATLRGLVEDLHETHADDHPCPCGSGSKFKHCCGA